MMVPVAADKKDACVCLFKALGLDSGQAFDDTIVDGRFMALGRLLLVQKNVIDGDTMFAIGSLLASARNTLADSRRCQSYISTGRHPSPEHRCEPSLQLIAQVMQAAAIGRATGGAGGRRGASGSEPAAAEMSRRGMGNQRRLRCKSASMAKPGQQGRKAGGKAAACIVPTVPLPPAPAPHRVDRMPLDSNGSNNDYVRPIDLSSRSGSEREAPRATRASVSERSNLLPYRPGPNAVSQTMVSNLQQAAVVAAAVTPVVPEVGPEVVPRPARPNRSPATQEVWYKRNIVNMLGHKRVSSRRSQAGSRTIIKCLWGPHNVEAGEDVEWLLQHHPRELAKYVERLRRFKPQAFRGLVRNVDGLLDRLADAEAVDDN